MRRILAPVLLALLLLSTPLLAAEPEPAVPVATEPSGEAPKASTLGESPKAEEKKAEPGEVAAQPPVKQPETVLDAVQDVGLLVEAAKNGNWVLFSGLLIMLLIFLLDKIVNLKARIPAKAVPWVAAVLGIVGSIAAQLTTGIPWGQALLQGFTAGVAAVGLWELIFKAVLAKKSSPPAAEDKAEPEPEAEKADEAPQVD